MTRRARIESATGIYHVMLRGINRQNIFEYKEDFERFKTCLEKAKETGGIQIFGYCLMSNHVHIVVCTGDEPIGTSLKRIGVSYVSWYNKKYSRQGALFQDRYRSEPIEDDRYLLAVLRYIHQNPVKAGICKSAEKYEWSSYADYTGTGDGLTDTGFALSIYSKKTAEQVRLFEEFMKEESGDVFVDIDDEARSPDDVLRERIIEICGAKSVAEFQALPPDERVRAMRLMRAGGMSIRQIVRHTGVSFGIVRGIGGG